MVLGKRFSSNRFQKMFSIIYFSGQYSSWLGHHQETLQNCVHLCINALSNPELIQSASIALKELTMENRMHMSKYLNDIFPIIKVIFKILIANEMI
jgi:hypothetical protein